MLKKLLIATSNPGKLVEIAAILADSAIDLVMPIELGLQLNVQEHGQTYAENAALKAQAYASASGMPVLADDSGLEVDALDGAPGLHSARYSPLPGASDADRRRYLLENLLGKPRPWTARFRCVVALASPHSQVHFSEGLCEGEIIPQERGTHGFGYDPIFLLPARGLTMAELPPVEKNRISHRARAVLAAKPLLAELLAG